VFKSESISICTGEKRKWAVSLSGVILDQLVELATSIIAATYLLMESRNMRLKLIRKTRETIKQLVKLFNGVSPIRYKVVAIDMELRKVSFRPKKKAAVITYSFSEAVADLDLIGGLTPEEASWIGGYFAKSLRGMSGKARSKCSRKSMDDLMSGAGSRYQIITRHRDGRVSYIDKLSKEKYQEHPVTIVTTKSILRDFSPSQACYIGILAGLGLDKLDSTFTDKDERTQYLNEYPKLRVVK
jgi:hypothetical protein